MVYHTSRQFLISYHGNACEEVADSYMYPFHMSEVGIMWSFSIKSSSLKYNSQ